MATRETPGALPVVLLHGFAQTAHMWRYQSFVLARIPWGIHGYRFECEPRAPERTNEVLAWFLA